MALHARYRIPFPAFLRVLRVLRHLCRRRACPMCLAALLQSGAATAALVINEFLPDPVGSDAGREFVELLNSGMSPISLAGVTLEFANGGAAVQWEVRWRADGAGSLAAGARLLIVDRNWQGPPFADAEVALGLQNGPDAVRLVRDDQVLDLVGYGPLTDPAMFRGAPVPVRVGLSLARRPDGRDSGHNGEDFVAATPTPGGANFAALSLALTAVEFDPPVAARPGASVHVAADLTNDGTEDLPSGACRLLWPGGESEGWWDRTASGGQRSLAYVMRPTARGLHPVRWEFAVPGTGDTLRLVLGAIQVGPGPLRLNEVLPAPGQGQGEWIELFWAGGGTGSLAGYSLADEDGTRVALPARDVLPGETLVAAEDSSGLRAWLDANAAAGEPRCLPGAAAVAILRLPTWPSLNNSPPESRVFADRVRLLDADCHVVDAVTWGGPEQELPERNSSLERLGPEPVNPGAAHWKTSTDPKGSTPGCPNSATAGPVTAATADLMVQPPLLAPSIGHSSVTLRFGLAADEQAWEAAVFNLWGDRVRDFGGDSRGPGPRELVWDGRDDAGLAVAPGIYIAWLETRSAAGQTNRRAKSRVVVR